MSLTRLKIIPKSVARSAILLGAPKNQQEKIMIRTITLTRDGECAKCGHALHTGGRARWSPGRDGGKVWCLSNGHHGHLTNSQFRTQQNMAASQEAWDRAFAGHQHRFDKLGGAS